MDFMTKLRKAQEKNNSLLCVGLDPALEKLPSHLREKQYPIFEFNKAIVEATCDMVCCYKPQFAYYAASGAEKELEMTMNFISEKCPEVPVILDSKRGDIGSTAEMYAKEAYDRYGADAVTVNPYMGTDTLKPFIDRADKGTVILCRTSNPSSGEIQDLETGSGKVYMKIAEYAATEWNYNKNIMLVVGATFPGELGQIRKKCGDIPFLVPGVGAQGGDVKKVLENGLDSTGAGLVINSSRGIIYAGKDENFAEASREAAKKLRDEINSFR